MVHPDDLLESFAFGEAPEAGPHVAACPPCSAQVELARAAAGWLATSHLATPPPGLRSRVLAAAVAVRPSSSAPFSSAYVAEVADLGVLLDSLSPAQWSAPTADGRSVRDLVRHLTGNDGNVLADLGVAQPSGHLWKDRSDLLLRTVGQGDETLLARPVRLAGKVPIRRPLRDALTQRAFETWIHRDDIRLAIALPPIPPASAHLARILAFGLALLPGAIQAAGRARPGSVLLTLTGPGGGDHLVPMGTPASSAHPAQPRPGQPRPGQPRPSQPGPSQAGPSQVGPSQVGPSQVGPSQVGPSQAGPGRAHPQAAPLDAATAEAARQDEPRAEAAPAGDGLWIAEVRMPAERFGRLMAGRVPVTPTIAVVQGDRSAALDLLAVAATLGCE
ncbi:maleylpyruvate isomerase N-terminal domain-containing protein [Actinoplanes subtropicus]|uniref:maleylpyruvate isomerase N-terminal domain-containing protein n=1 Tax=Actinoplanes subtropicus TaxID=543632 RepID=UPI0004C4178C|nr:maleylpyruvate isomerase N-terminal domain-containing protein [Actinoplanes subtropicus]